MVGLSWIINVMKHLIIENETIKMKCFVYVFIIIYDKHGVDQLNSGYYI